MFDNSWSSTATNTASNAAVASSPTCSPVKWIGGDLWTVILAHGLTDTIGMTALYLDLPVV